MSRLGKFSQAIDRVIVYLRESLEARPMPLFIAWSAALSISLNAPVAIPSELIAVFELGLLAEKHDYIAVPIGIFIL